MLTLHLAPPFTSTSPEPMMFTSALLLAWALTSPEPAIDTEVVSVAMPAASIPPEPVISYSAFFARPFDAFASPDPAMTMLRSPTSS